MEKNVVAALLIVVVFFFGCGITHPSSVIVDPEFNPNAVTRILVTPVISCVSETDDRDRLSELTTQRVLWENLNRMSDYVFLSQQNFYFALSKAKKTAEIKKFKRDWLEGKKAGAELLKLIGKYVDVDAILVPEIYLWHKDEADYREQGASSVTQVGMTIYLVNPLSGKILWEATDQDYLEAMRTEGDRVLVQGAGGFDRRIAGISETGVDMYGAPPFENVLTKVVGTLVKAFPFRSTVGK
ncbi:hypothetical protein J7M07_06065 [bacterium]|nr:hypothetical protein [bacterium]